MFQAIDRVISVQVYTWAAQEGLEATEPAIAAFIQFQDGLGVLFYVLGFLALGLYGMAISRRPEDAGLGWLFVGGGIVGILLAVIGAVIPAMIFFGTAALGVATWVTQRPAGQHALDG